MYLWCKRHGESMIRVENQSKDGKESEAGRGHLSGHRALMLTRLEYNPARRYSRGGRISDPENPSGHRAR